MTDREKDIAAMNDIIGKDSSYIKEQWLKFAKGWDNAWCSETACVISYLGGNIEKIPISNYAEGLLNKFKSMGRYDNKPQRGDFIFFGYNAPDHTGRIFDITNEYIITVEGNINGRVVTQWWGKNSGYIIGYGHPLYSDNDNGDEIMTKLLTLQKGSTGNQVKNLQALLNLWTTQSGKYPAISVDGVFGTVTENRLKLYQKLQNLTVDGVCGPITWTDILIN